MYICTASEYVQEISKKGQIEREFWFSFQLTFVRHLQGISLPDCVDRQLVALVPQIFSCLENSHFWKL